MGAGMARGTAAGVGAIVFEADREKARNARDQRVAKAERKYLNHKFMIQVETKPRTQTSTRTDKV
jgi:hypothetical protein